ncbi:MAG TPA: hypothetical protein VGQ57_11185 [Polyangiaceae bacterium]|jgi:hypothetical protein|nr:hypothetical protein [Polyangiaceae bacterium]
MRALGWLLGAFLTLGCSSEAIDGQSRSSTEPGPGPSDTSSTPPTSAASGNFEPQQSYPPGPYGHGLGAVIENLEFIGWRDPAGASYDVNQFEHVRLGDFYDPTGAQTELLVLNASAVWCVVCQSEARDMKTNDTYQAFHARKVQMLTTLFEDQESNPAKPSDLVLWGSSKQREIDFPLVLDPALKMGIYFTSDATPLNLVIDARTMTIIDVMMGYDGTPGTGMWGRIDQLLKARGL